MSPLVLIAVICGYDHDADRYVRDCGPYEQRVASVQECRDVAAHLRTIAPAGVRVVKTECFRADERRPAIAEGKRK